MKFSVIIPTYNEEKYIGSCIESILNQSYKKDDFEIIVSDANSKDRTREIVSKYPVLLVTTNKRGIALGRNFGAKHAKGDILVFFDGDVVVDTDFLKQCEIVFNDSRIVGMTGLAKPADGNIITKSVYRCTYLLVRFFNFFGLSLFPGVCVAYRREAFEAVGGFRKDLGITEDLDLSRRISKNGKCILYSKAFVYVTTRRLQKNLVSTVLFHIWNDIRYLLTGTAARLYPKTDEVRSWKDLWMQNRMRKNND